MNQTRLMIRVFTLCVQLRKKGDLTDAASNAERQSALVAQL